MHKKASGALLAVVLIAGACRYDWESLSICYDAGCDAAPPDDGSDRSDLSMGPAADIQISPDASMPTACTDAGGGMSMCKIGRLTDERPASSVCAAIGKVVCKEFPAGANRSCRVAGGFWLANVVGTAVNEVAQCRNPLIGEVTAIYGCGDGQEGSGAIPASASCKGFNTALRCGAGGTYRCKGPTNGADDVRTIVYADGGVLCCLP